MVEGNNSLQEDDLADTQEREGEGREKLATVAIGCRSTPMPEVGMELEDSGEMS